MATKAPLACAACVYGRMRGSWGVATKRALARTAGVHGATGGSHRAVCRAPYVLYGVVYIDPVSLTSFPGFCGFSGRRT